MELLYGRAAMEKLASSGVAVFGLGGVGGYIAEALARSGIGALDLIDGDVIDITNINRQILATTKTIGEYKADAAAARMADINPECRVRVHRLFYMPDTRQSIDFKDFDYVADAIDTVVGKMAIIENAKKAGVPVISSMGTGNKFNPALLETADIYETSVCPLARAVRNECRKRGIDSLKVVYSKEKPVKSREVQGGEESGAARVPGSVAFVPPVAGLIIAGVIINDLTVGCRRESIK